MLIHFSNFYIICNVRLLSLFTFVRFCGKKFVFLVEDRELEMLPTEKILHFFAGEVSEPRLLHFVGWVERSETQQFANRSFHWQMGPEPVTLILEVYTEKSQNAHDQTRTPHKNPDDAHQRMSRHFAG